MKTNYGRKKADSRFKAKILLFLLQIKNIFGVKKRIVLKNPSVAMLEALPVAMNWYIFMWP